MTPQQLLKTLQLNDSLFPTGAFAYSDGLETAVANALVADTATLEQWLEHYVTSVFALCDGRAVLLAMDAHSRCDWNSLRILDQQLTALKPAACMRSSSAALGRGFLKSVRTFHKHPDLDRVERELRNHPVIYGVVFSTLEIDRRLALVSFAYARLAGMISAALRLMSLGQQQGQQILNRVLQRVPAAVDRILESGDAELMSFVPMLDIQQMNHRHVYSRLFRS